MDNKRITDLSEKLSQDVEIYEKANRGVSSRGIETTRRQQSNKKTQKVTNSRWFLLKTKRTRSGNSEVSVKYYRTQFAREWALFTGIFKRGKNYTKIDIETLKTNISMNWIRLSEEISPEDKVFITTIYPEKTPEDLNRLITTVKALVEAKAARQDGLEPHVTVLANIKKSIEMAQSISSLRAKLDGADFKSDAVEAEIAELAGQINGLDESKFYSKENLFLSLNRLEQEFRHAKKIQSFKQRINDYLKPNSALSLKNYMDLKNEIDAFVTTTRNLDPHVFEIEYKNKIIGLINSDVVPAMAILDLIIRVQELSEVDPTNFSQIEEKRQSIIDEITRTENTIKVNGKKDIYKSKIDELKRTTNHIAQSFVSATIQSYSEEYERLLEEIKFSEKETLSDVLKTRQKALLDLNIKSDKFVNDVVRFNDDILMLNHSEEIQKLESIKSKVNKEENRKILEFFENQFSDDQMFSRGGLNRNKFMETVNAFIEISSDEGLRKSYFYLLEPIKLKIKNIYSVLGADQQNSLSKALKNRARYQEVVKLFTNSADTLHQMKLLKIETLKASQESLLKMINLPENQDVVTKSEEFKKVFSNLNTILMRAVKEKRALNQKDLENLGKLLAFVQVKKSSLKNRRMKDCADQVIGIINSITIQQEDWEKIVSEINDLDRTISMLNNPSYRAAQIYFLNEGDLIDTVNYKLNKLVEMQKNSGQKELTKEIVLLRKQQLRLVIADYEKKLINYPRELQWFREEVKGKDVNQVKSLYRFLSKNSGFMNLILRITTEHLNQRQILKLKKKFIKFDAGEMTREALPEVPVEGDLKGLVSDLHRANSSVDFTKIRLKDNKLENNLIELDAIASKSGDPHFFRMSHVFHQGINSDGLIKVRELYSSQGIDVYRQGVSEKFWLHMFIFKNNEGKTIYRYVNVLAAATDMDAKGDPVDNKFHTHIVDAYVDEEGKQAVIKRYISESFDSVKEAGDHFLELMK